jgi:hypothetical protein
MGARFRIRLCSTREAALPFKVVCAVFVEQMKIRVRSFGVERHVVPERASPFGLAVWPRRSLSTLLLQVNAEQKLPPPRSFPSIITWREGQVRRWR